MADFKRYIPRLFDAEGKLGDVTNHKNDKGGWTNAGITLKTFRSFYGQTKTVTDLRNMTYEQWYRIMRTYWDACKADRINNQSIAELVVDWNINSGISGKKGVQEALGTVADGIFGPKTLAAINAQPQKCVFCKIMEGRKRYFQMLSDKDESQKDNLTGWLNRLQKFVYQDE